MTREVWSLRRAGSCTQGITREAFAPVAGQEPCLMIEAQCLIPQLWEVNGSPEKLKYLMQDSLLNVFAPSEPGFFDRQNNSADNTYTGGKSPNNQWAHAEYIENPVNK